MAHQMCSVSGRAMQVDAFAGFTHLLAQPCEPTHLPDNCSVNSLIGFNFDNMLTIRVIIKVKCSLKLVTSMAYLCQIVKHMQASNANVGM